MSKTTSYRPFLFGERDRHIFRVDMGEVSIRAINDANGNPTYVGYSLVDTDESHSKWQIRKITYDGNQGVTTVEWPVNSDGVASNNYEFVWDDVLTLSYR